MRKLLTITELSKKLNLINSDDKKPLNHILRYWEKEFKQIRPKKIKNRRYYSPEQVETIKMIKFYVKDKGMTITGVKNLLNEINYWNSAPVCTPKKIKVATKDWFKYLANK